MTQSPFREDWAEGRLFQKNYHEKSLSEKNWAEEIAPKIGLSQPGEGKKKARHCRLFERFVTRDRHKALEETQHLFKKTIEDALHWRIWRTISKASCIVSHFEASDYVFSKKTKN